MKRSIQAFIAIMITFMMASPSYAILYNLNRTVGAGSVSGYISTDGTTGSLAEVNIVDFGITFDDGTNPAVTLNGLMSGNTGRVHFSPNGAGNPLSATPTELVFNFDGAGFAHFDGLAGLFDDGQDFYCFDAGAGHCNIGGTGRGEIIRVGSGANDQVVNLSGQVTIARIPEPGTLAIMGLGLVGLGLARRKRAA